MREEFNNCSDPPSELSSCPILCNKGAGLHGPAYLFPPPLYRGYGANEEATHSGWTDELVTQSGKPKKSELVNWKMSRILGPCSGQRTGFQAGFIVSRRIAKGQYLRAGFLTLLLCLLACAPAGATSRGLLRMAGSKVGLLGPARAREGGRILSQTEKSSLSKSVAFNHRFGGVKEILSTEPKERKPLWCVAKNYANPDLILTSLNWACSKSGGVDCKPIQRNGSCFQPDTLLNHASYAFNMYYQKNGFAQITCDFDGAATLTSMDPSTPGCVYLNSIVASNNTVYSSSLSTSICSRGCMAAVVGSVLLSSIMS